MALFHYIASTAKIEQQIELVEVVVDAAAAVVEAVVAAVGRCLGPRWLSEFVIRI